MVLSGKVENTEVKIETEAIVEKSEYFSHDGRS